MERIIDAAPEWLKPMVILSYYTGMRQGEMRLLEWKNVDLQTGVIYLPSSKTMKDRSGLGQRIVMQRELIELLGAIPRRDDLIFVRPGGGPYSQDSITKAFKKVLKALGIDTEKYSWKEIRHTTASIMNLKGSPPMAIKNQLRHTQLKTTEDFYIGSNIEYQREQNEKLKLNSGKIVGNALPLPSSISASA